EKILIGVHVRSNPSDLTATLNALHWNTHCAFDLMLLADGPDETLKQALLSHSRVEQSATEEPRGAPACFNRLVTHGDADWYVFLESGSLAGRDWWSRIPDALAARPSHGLAGPSTNRAWNEQCVFPTNDAAYATVLQNASAAALKFGSTWQTLEPLY